MRARVHIISRRAAAASTLAAALSSASRSFDYEPDTLLPEVVSKEDGDANESEGEGEGEAAGAHKRDDDSAEAARPAPSGRRLVQMRGVGASAEIDQFPLIDLWARLARRLGVNMGRPAPPSSAVLFSAATG